ncbi:MAG: hypothetical protein IPI21_08450 [Propionivibrio sp.]|nr:hypothetical protein [Propionivibrio sp.]
MCKAAKRLLPKIIVFLSSHFVATFLVMGLAFVGFGLTSLNLLYLIRANVELVLQHGALGLFGGGRGPFLGVRRGGVGGLAMYLVFKVCEHILVEKLVHKHGE